MGSVLDNLKELDFVKIIVFLIIPILLLAGFFTIPLEKKEIEFPAELYISEDPSFVDIRNIEGKKGNTLNFGGVSAGYKIEKFISLSLSEDAPPSDVDFKVTGKIKDMIKLRKDNKLITGFVMYEPTRISVKAEVPKGTPAGEYYGNVKVTYSKTMYRKLLNALNI